MPPGRPDSRRVRCPSLVRPFSRRLRQGVTQGVGVCGRRLGCEILCRPHALPFLHAPMLCDLPQTTAQHSKGLRRWGISTQGPPPIVGSARPKEPLTAEAGLRGTACH